MTAPRDTNRPDSLPTDPRTGEPIAPRAQPGYYPGFRTLDQQKFWDARTREVVLERVDCVPAMRFFDPREARLLEAVCDRILPQDDRDPTHRIPIAPQIDRRLHDNVHDGYRYEGMPPDGEAYRLGLRAIDEIALHLHARGFVAVDTLAQERILRSLHDGEAATAQAIWQRMPVRRFWMLLVTDCIDAYYAHPFAWDEIGFGGPAYPRGYMRLERGDPEPWERDEQRYAWKAPQASVSDVFEPIAGGVEQSGSPSQGGTH